MSQGLEEGGSFTLFYRYFLNVVAKNKADRGRVSLNKVQLQDKRYKSLKYYSGRPGRKS